ncbi:hypothetical protein E0485_21365 [Paenibacillus albiflavus]|uniref:DUF3139 domain-containing protein n=1 Tax=Paenibacillus albiflavus TaxID=2545760 RepID=A0A4R4E1F5_9BACL|nr:hypothetical protein [Paenibacillus albiflavus]TCZ73246.1 hypothetical protein E0485_21365 [Paenibacillus albiflavus]
MAVKKKIGYSIILLIIVIIILGFFQVQKPILTEHEAIFKAKMYLDTVNQKLNLTYNTNIVQMSLLNNDTLWSKVTGNRTWYIHIDGVAVILEAYTGKFFNMVFPLDGVITREENPDWF